MIQNKIDLKIAVVYNKRRIGRDEMAKRMVMLIIVVVILTTIFCACKISKEPGKPSESTSVSQTETESGSQSSDKTDGSQNSGSSDNNEVESDENGEWWGIEF